MKNVPEHVIAQKYLRCKQRNFELDHGALIFLRDASSPMITWLQEVHINDSEALLGNTDFLMRIPTVLTNKKTETTKVKACKQKKRQLYFRLRPKNQD
ncbi:hypothetical protein [Kordia sp.]|uniref:hypothetical protein n=1 Tax=Kordia sp. TaxID=1965332 RepID=UPI003D6B9510